MGRKVGENRVMLYSRLFIVLGLVAIPAYLWALMLFLPVGTIRFAINDPTLNVLTQYLLAPLFFSVPWVLFLYFNRDRLAESLKHMNQTATVIPMRWKVFYGFNTLVILLFFVIPILSPVLAVAGGVVLAGRIYFAAGSLKDKRRRAKALVLFFLLVFLAGLPTLILIYFFSSYGSLSGIIGQTWFGHIDYIYSISLCIGDALAIGSLLWFIYAGAAEFEFQTYGMYVTKTPAKLIRVFEFVLFIVFAYVGLQYIWIPGVVQVPLGGIGASGRLSIINDICLAIVAVIFLLSTLRGLRRKGERNSAWGLIFLIAFLSIEILSHYINYLPTVAVFSATALFLVMFFISYRSVGPTQ
jgi:hypothetical protein